MISICMATYNGEKYIKEQIESILSQLDEYDELIISDDKSKDGTEQVVMSIGDKRIQFITHTTPKDYTTNFENALKHCKGDYIFLCDQDDVWMGNKVSKMMEYLTKGYDFVVCNATVTDESLHTLIEDRNHYYNIKNGFIRNFIKSRYLGCCFAFNRKVYDASLPFPRNSDLAHHDSWISLVAEAKFRTTVLDDKLILYRRHNLNTSTGGETRSSLYKIIKIRLYLLIHILKRLFA